MAQLPLADHGSSSELNELSVMARHKDPAPMEKSGSIEDVALVTETQHDPTGEARIGGSDTRKPPKKSLSFNLAFMGLALTLLVFQLDATCLGIALPVSPKPALQLSRHKY